MKKSTKLLASLAATLLVAGSVLPMAACSEETVSGITTENIPVTAYNGEKVTISFYHCMGSALSDILKDGVADFNKLYPNIKVLTNSFGDYEGVRDQISTEIASGRAPSLAYCYPDHVALYNKSKTVLPLDSWIESTLEVKQANNTTALMGMTQAEVDNYVPVYWDEGKIFDEAKTMYTLPMLKSTELLYYNKTYFDANSLTVPTTWDEMEATCQRILEIEGAKAGGAEANPCIPLGYDSGANWFITMTEQLGSGYTTSEKGNYFTFNNETNRAFVEEFRGWYQNKYVTTKEIFGNYTSDLFVQVEPSKTKCYMCIGSSAGAGYQCPAVLQDGKTYPFEVGVAMIPQENPESPKIISQGPSICLFKKQNKQEVAAAWLFSKFITSNEKFQAKCSMNNGYTPAIQSIKDNTTYKNFLNRADGNKYLQATAVQATMEMKDYYYVSPAFNGSSAARDEMALLLKHCFQEKPDSGKTVSQMIESFFNDSYKKLQRRYDK